MICPPDFAKIPPDSPQAVVLASVPDTPQAELALVANSVPTTATVNRRDAKIELTYDGEPKFKPIEGTAMSYAVNAQLPVIRTGENYYALDNGVWFTAASATGPWQVAAEVPEEIYTIPPSSPVYYATFARVYQADEERWKSVTRPVTRARMRMTARWSMARARTTSPGTANDYYGWGWTWGYSYFYVPWYQWWVWRPWWDQPGGLRAAVIENIYDRWQGRNGVMPHDRPANAAADAASRGLSVIPPCTGGSRAQPVRPRLTPPAQHTGPESLFSARNRSGARAGFRRRAIALRRPKNARRRTRPLRLAGRKYLPTQKRRLVSSSGRRQLEFFAPTQGSIRHRVISWLPGAEGASRRRSRLSAHGRTQRGSAESSGGRGPDAKNSAPRRAREEVGALEREYYARSLSQARAQNWRASGAGGSQPVRRGGGRR